MVAVLNSFSVLEKVIRISNSTVEIERRLKSLLQLFQRDIGVDRVYLFTLDREAEVLALRTMGDETDRPNLKIRLNNAIIGKAVLKRETVFAEPDDIQVLAETSREFFEGFDTLAAFPIMDDQILYGVLTLLHREKITYEPDLTALIETISREMAGTIRNSRLYAESKKRIAELSVLYEVGRAVSSTINLDQVLDTVVNITCKVLLAGGCALNVLDVRTGALRVASEYGFIPPACSFKHLLTTINMQAPPEVLSCVNRTEPYLGRSNDAPSCPGMRLNGREVSLICLPLHFKSNFKGTLSVFHTVSSPADHPREFNHEDLELLSTMGAMISSSLENALTFQAVDGLARKNELLVRNLSCLYEISSAMMTTVKTDELLSIIGDALTLKQGLDFDRALILLMNEEDDCLIGEAVKEVTVEEKTGINQSLAELLRTDRGKQNLPTDRVQDSLDLKLPLDKGTGILVRTAKEKRAFNVTSENGEYVLEPGLPTGFGRKSFATVPMLAKGRVVGVIAVDRDHSGLEITSEDMRNLSMLANQAGLAFENSTLYEYIEQMNSALTQTRERLLEAEKLAALGEMAAGMAHEIRNPLVSIGGFTRRLLKTMEENSPHRVYIEVIINEVTRLEKTLSEVLDFSRDTLGHLDEYNINDVVTESLYILRREFKDGRIEIVKELSEVQPVLVDERQIKHVFFNLFFNASQAMENGGKLIVRTYPTQVDDRIFVACEVTDTGPGIPPEILPNIFNPFFTTKDSGTGLGLSIVHKIVNRHHGEIDVVNRNTGQGATFIIKLPVAAEAGLYLK